eukprot:TRINITY_DN4081_c0_g1_i1.p1 TRINITY_DN4081_c0_g1~~TRINITY_DN4081_c0_g1_i1.p1  ORF type:complete len:441 (+),score=88.25 TRINITY_DN4081_c0_g1_i1:212-1534(+)
MFDDARAYDNYGSGDKGLTCFIVRTYKKQLSSLPRFIKGLRAFNYQRWVALFLNTDNTPFHELPLLLQSYSDNRLIELKDVRSVRPYTVRYSFKITDQAIHHCPNTSRWLVITNGDNFYLPTFLDFLAPESDVVGVNWFSRYYLGNFEEAFWRRPPCTRFNDTSPCMSNVFDINLTDLGANVVNLVRWRKEGRAYMKIKDCLAESLDGCMIARLRLDGWKIKHVPACWFSHHPNPWICQFEEKIWIDSPTPHRGRCVTVEELQELPNYVRVDTRSFACAFDKTANYSWKYAFEQNFAEEKEGHIINTHNLQEEVEEEWIKKKQREMQERQGKRNLAFADKQVADDSHSEKLNKGMKIAEALQDTKKEEVEKKKGVKQRKHLNAIAEVQQKDVYDQSIKDRARASAYNRAKEELEYYQELEAIREMEEKANPQLRPKMFFN